MSGGERQMVAIGRAMMSAPVILMLDEPSLGLAPLVCSELFRSLKRIKETGVGIFLVEQNAKQRLAIADRGYLPGQRPHRRVGPRRRAGQGREGPQGLSRRRLEHDPEKWEPVSGLPNALRLRKVGEASLGLDPRDHAQTKRAALTRCLKFHCAARFCAVHNYSTAWGLIGQIGPPRGACATRGTAHQVFDFGNVNRRLADPGTTLELIERETDAVERRAGVAVQRRAAVLGPLPEFRLRLFCRRDGQSPPAAQRVKQKGRQATMTTKTEIAKPGRISRRTFLKTSAGSAALLAAVQSQFPFGVHVAQAAGPEVKKAKLGFIALTDAAPLFVAKEKGLSPNTACPTSRSPSRPPGARRATIWCSARRRQRHRRRAHPDADAVPDLGRQGDAEQPADADVHPGAAQPRQPVHLGRQGIRRPRSRRSTPRRSRRRWRRRKPPASRSKPP